MAPSGELRGKGRCGVFAGETVWSTPERLRGEAFTTRRYTNLRLPWPIIHFNCQLTISAIITHVNSVQSIVSNIQTKIKSSLIKWFNSVTICHVPCKLPHGAHVVSLESYMLRSLINFRIIIIIIIIDLWLGPCVSIANANAWEGM